MAVALTFVEITRPDVLTERQFAKALNAGLRLAAFRFLQGNFGKHFKDVPENQPGGAYGVLPRNPKYNERKRKRVGHTIPNLLTGRSRNYMRSNSVITATSTRGARLRIRNRFAMPDRMRRELETMTAEERVQAAEVTRKYVEDEAEKKAQTRQRVRVI